MNINRQKQQGFTLIELAVVLFIIGLLTVGLLGPVATQVESQERQKTTDTMEDIMEALYGFAIVNGYLPCPDTGGDGAQDFAGALGNSACIASDGWLPWQTLGLNIQGDVWGNRFRYHVATPGFTTIDTGICSAADSELDLCQVGTIAVRTRGDDTGTPAVVESKAEFNAATFVPAVIVSHGKNGLGATTINNVVLAAAAGDEAENTNGDGVFYSRNFSIGGDGCVDSDADETEILCEFDDIVMWLSPSILANRMVKAEVLP